MSSDRLAIHGHFYQPSREDPFSGLIPPESGAAPYRDWNDRIAAECYGPNAAAGNFGRIGFDLGPTLARWLRRERPETHDAIAAQARGPNAMAQPFHHAILPLATLRDRRTEIAWGLRDAELRYGHRPLGLWLPETAVDLLSLRLAAEAGVRYTILAPWQAATSGLDHELLYRVAVGGGRDIVVAFYDGQRSAAVSFEPSATADAEQFAQALQAGSGEGADAQVGITLVATDGELYGHHLEFRDLFLETLTTMPTERLGRRLTTVGEEVAEADVLSLPEMAIRDQTSWSCHHGILRWSGRCPDALDGRWKRPLRVALERLAAAIDGIAQGEATRLGIDIWAARDAWVDVASGYREPGAGVESVLAQAVAGRPAVAARLAPADATAVELLLRAQTSRLAMFASDAWFWADPDRPETIQALRLAGHAARLMDDLIGSRLEAALVADLAAVQSSSTPLDGAQLYAHALRGVDQPVSIA